MMISIQTFYPHHPQRSLLFTLLEQNNEKQALCAVEPFREYLLSDECEQLLLEHTTTKNNNAKTIQTIQTTTTMKKKNLHSSHSSSAMTTNTTNNANPNEMNFNERRHRTRRGNENNTSTSSSAQQLQQRGAYYHHEEILSFPRGKTMSAHGSGEKIESNGNTLSGGGGGGLSGLGGGSGNLGKKTSFNPRAPAMTRERRADVARGAAREGACLGKELRRVVRTLRCGGYEAFPPTELLKAVWRFVPAFAGSAQQDAHEFARFALERLRKELLVGERMMKKREENDRFRREYEENALLESGFDWDEKHGGRRRNGEDAFDDDKVLPGKVPKRARSFRPRKANASLTTSPIGSNEGSPRCALVGGSPVFATKNLLAGEGDRESDLLDKGGGRVAGRGDIFLTGYDIGNNETPTLGFLNNKNANPFQREADEQARQQQQQQQQQQQLLHASSESVDTKEGLLTNNKHSESPDTVEDAIDPNLKGFVIVSRWGAVEHKYGCSCRPCKSKRLKLEKENPSATQAQNDRSTQTTQVLKTEDGSSVMSLHDVLNLKTPGKLTPVRTAAQKKRNAGGIPTAVQKLVAEAKNHMASIESPKFDPTTPHTYFADAENMSDDPIWKIFGGVAVSHVKCSECGQSNAMKEPFLDLSLPLPNVSRPMTRATSPPLVNLNALGLSNAGSNQNDLDDCSYWDHSAPIDGNGPNGEATIEQCLEAHTREECLDGGDGSNGGGGNRYYCEQCQAVTSATKRTSLNRECPKVLVLHLKRFMWKGKSGQRAKIIAPVAFPLDNLSLEPFLEPESEEKDDDDVVVVVEKPAARGKSKSSSKKGGNKRKSSAAANEEKQRREGKITANAEPSKSSTSFTYDLSACVAHHGQAANAGHYTAVARDLAGDNRWRQFDDDRVRDVCDEEVKSIASQGYVFFYVRRDSDSDSDSEDDDVNDDDE
jgi:ubiquitin C-terminal hydrolase